MTERDPTAFAILLYAVVAMAALTAAYFAIFTQFASYDDEGTLLLTLKAFVHGDALYKDVWSVYGPFYYEVFGGFFGLTGFSVTNDAGRTIVIVVWVLASLLFGVAAQRLTGRLALGLTAMIVAFADLAVLVNEPMHPQGLCVVLLGAFVLVAICGRERRSLATGAGCGALLAALLLTKVNLGVFAIAAVVVAAAVTVDQIHRRSWLRWLVFVAFLAMPALVLDRDYGLSAVREFLVIEVLAAISVLVASRPLWPAPREADDGTFRWLLAAAGGFIVAFAAIVLVVILTGPSPQDVYDGVIKDAFGIRDILTGALPFPAGAAIDWSIAAVAAAAIASRVRSVAGSRPSLWFGAVRAVAGLAILFTIARNVPVALSPSPANPVLVPLLLAWIAAIPPTAATEAPFKRMLRVLLPMLAIAESLQVYPVPGSQLGIAALVFVPVGALCLADAIVELREWSAKDEATLRNFSATVGALAVALPTMLGLNAIVLAGASNAQLYRHETKLPFAGAELIRQPPPTTELYARLVDLLHGHGCTTFIGYPSVNSLYLWSGLEAPRPQVPNAWVYALNRSQQERAVSELRASPRPCALRNEDLAASYLRGAPPPDEPLVNYVLNEFRPIEEVGPFVFELPKPSATGRSRPGSASPPGSRRG